MKSINKWIYGPTPEEKVREWRRKLRQNQREVDREITNVGHGVVSPRDEA